VSRLERKRPTVEGLPAVNPKAGSKAQTDRSIIPPRPSRVTQLREYLTLATISRAPRLASRCYGRKAAAQ
jgi:hypothetical protein